MKEKPNLIYHVGEYIVENIQQFMFPKPQTFVCTIAEPHLVKANIVFISEKKEGAFIYCREHHDFFDVSYNEVCGGRGKT